MVTIARTRWTLARGKAMDSPDRHAALAPPHDSPDVTSVANAVEFSTRLPHVGEDLQVGARLKVLLKHLYCIVAAEGLGPSHVFLLSELPPSGMGRSELADRLGVTRQACGQTVSQLVASGHVRVRTSNQRAQFVLRTALGERAVDAYSMRMVELENEWRHRVGDERYVGFRSVLAELTCPAVAPQRVDTDVGARSTARDAGGVPRAVYVPSIGEVVIHDEAVPMKLRRDSVAAKRSPPVRICVNCGASWQAKSWHLKAYCSVPCGSVAKAVRDARSAHARYGGRLPDSVAAAVKRKIAIALGGGYRRTPVPAEIDAAVRARNGGLCEAGCGRSGEQVHHDKGDSNEAADLKHLCVPCHDEQTDARIQPIPAGRLDVKLLRDELYRRTSAATPERPCDDHMSWSAVEWCRGPGILDARAATPHSMTDRR